MTEPFARAARRRSWGLAALTAVLVVALDQGSKQIVVATIDRGHPVDLPLGFQLANVRNNGVAFGLLGGAGTLVLVLTLVTMVVLLGYFAARAQDPGVWLAVGLVIGGATGNLIDRARLGAAIDFIDPPAWPAFNFADVAIVVGVALLAMSMLFPHDGRSRE
jgi:signal peptidase II